MFGGVNVERFLEIVYDILCSKRSLIIIRIIVLIMIVYIVCYAYGIMQTEKNFLAEFTFVYGIMGIIRAFAWLLELFVE